MRFSNLEVPCLGRAMHSESCSPSLGFAWPLSETAYAIVMLGFLSIFMLCMGVIDILIGVRLIQANRGFSELIRVFAFVNLIAGTMEVSIILSPLALLLMPVSLVILGLVLLRDKEEAEFV